MRKIATGIQKFQQNVYPKHQELFEELAKGQNPATLLITCSDSRIVPEMIMQAGPGELFVYRNAGNIIPPYRAEDGSGTLATIEYAVAVVKVKHLIVCGHSDCGAMKGVLHPESVAHLPAVDKWLRQAECARQIVCQHHGHLEEPEKLKLLIQENVLAQLESVKTHPAVAVALSQGTLDLHGLYYDIGSGEIAAYDTSTGVFRPVLEVLPSAMPAETYRRLWRAA